MNSLEKSQTHSSEFESQQRVNRYSIFVIAFISLSSAAYGYAGSIIATTLTQPSFYASMDLETNPHVDSLIGAMNGLFYAGGAIGAFLAGWVGQKYGRKAAVIMGNVIVLITGALLTGSVNVSMFIVFRFFCGLGAYAILASAPLWVSELAPPKVRGILTDIHAVGMMTGYALAAYSGLGWYTASGHNQWRGAYGIQVVLPSIILCGIYWIPESPRFLIMKGRVAEAWTIVHRLHSDPADPNDEFAKREFYQMRKQIELEAALVTPLRDFFIKPSLRKRVMISMFLQFAFMSSGILVILNYGSIIWAGLGYTTEQILNFQGGFQLTGLVFNVIAMTFVDKFKRTTLIPIGLMGCSITVAVEAALQKYYLGGSNKPGLAACTAVIFIFQATYSVLLDGPTFFYLAEIWPTHLRPQGFALGIATMCTTNIVWLQAAPSGFATIGWKFYLFFVIITGVASMVVLFTFPETLHKPLEEIAALFGDADMVVVTQQDLDHTRVGIETLDQAIPDGKAAGEQVEVYEKSNSS